MRQGFRFHLKEEGSNWRDVWHQGDCDTGCSALAAALGWQAELDALIDSKGKAAATRAPWAQEELPQLPPAEEQGGHAPPSAEQKVPRANFAVCPKRQETPSDASTSSGGSWKLCAIL